METTQFWGKENKEFAFTAKESFHLIRPATPELSSSRYVDGDFVFYLLFFIPVTVAIVLAIILCIKENVSCKCCCKRTDSTGFNNSSPTVSDRNPYERMDSDSSTDSDQPDNSNHSDTSTQSINLPDYNTVVLSDTGQEPRYPEVKSPWSVDAPPPGYDDIKIVID